MPGISIRHTFPLLRTTPSNGRAGGFALAAAVIGLALAGCAPASDVAPPSTVIVPPSVVDTAPVAVEYGVASWYRPRSKKSRTATGEHFDGVALTAAHRTLPFNTMVRVINLSNGRSAVLRINDRGPSDRRRAIDVSAEAAAELDMKRDGLAAVRIEVLPAYEAASRLPGEAASMISRPQ